MSDNDDHDREGDEECPPSGECVPCCTLCDGDTNNNHWFTEGVCMLDMISASQVTYILQHNPIAAADLKRVTTNEDLHRLADEVPLLDTVEEEDRLMQNLNERNPLPFYQIFRGNLNNM